MIATYVYDKLGQLTRVNDPSDTTSGSTGTTWTYEYDRGGNILNKKRYAYTTGTVGSVLQTITYTYDTTWKDKLAKYNGTAITYDAIGNPLTDGTWTYTWEKGRQLKQMTKSGTTATFLYNADGLRIRKTVGSTVTNYTLHGKNIVHMTQSSNTLHFWYDAQNRPAIVQFNGTKYGYIHNLQGDVIGLIDTSGNEVVKYVYDAWGKILSTTGSLASTLGAVQPFRYRSYVYDQETGLYYLRSRYYVPEISRFLNADIYYNVCSYTMYGYCKNNSVNRYDGDGFSDISISELTAAIEFLTEVYNYSQNHANDENVISTDVFMLNCIKFAKKGYTYNEYECAYSIAKCIEPAKSATGSSTMFREWIVAEVPLSTLFIFNLIPQGAILAEYDPDDKDGRPYNHTGISDTPAYVYESSAKSKGFKRTLFSDQEWNTVGWHKSVVLTPDQLVTLSKHIAFLQHMKNIRQTRFPVRYFRFVDFVY